MKRAFCATTRKDKEIVWTTCLVRRLSNNVAFVGRVVGGYCWCLKELRRRLSLCFEKTKIECVFFFKKKIMEKRKEKAFNFVYVYMFMFMFFF